MFLPPWLGVPGGFLAVLAGTLINVRRHVLHLPRPQRVRWAGCRQIRDIAMHDFPHWVPARTPCVNALHFSKEFPVRMTSLSLWLAGCLLALPLSAPAATPAPPAAPARVLLMGTFHFANPGLDEVKSPVTDVTTPVHQAWLERFAQRLVAGYAPTDVLVECAAGEQSAYDAHLAGYRAGTRELGVNEVEQIGLRVARLAGLERITCFDQREVQWDGGSLMAFLQAHEPATLAQLQEVFGGLSQREADEQASLPLGALLRLSNSAGRDRENRDLYLLTNAVDAGASYAGADAAASWWRRNFHMYANVQKAAAPGRRVFVLAGSGHTAVMRDLLASDRAREAVDITPYLVD